VPGGDRPLVQWTLVFACVLIVVLAVLLMQRERREQAQVRELNEALRSLTEQHEKLERQATSERAAREAFQIGLDRERAINAPAAVALQPGLDPRAPLTQLRIPPELPRVPLILPLAARYDRYRVTLRDFRTGEELWSHARLAPDPDGKRVFVVLPAEVLSAGRYELVLSGFDRAGQAQEAGVFVFEAVR
jgi:hypothetical protein